MKTSYPQFAGLLAGVLAAASIFAQSPTPPETPGAQPSDPSAASSPHQRAATKAPSAEASASTPSDTATPHQKQTMKKKHKKKAQTAAPSNQS